ncbi:alpha/beta-hydrolase [Sparassis crispa]|uniref:Alpha/beta-hydrolase n=1 Tax=Sparassis crispa TaxID=139825 RepID=A0A401GLD2_9APHY|nr:alpha/beta-hydrolase [Sparassis crispa]GBE82975.1 alpha/beta-hydrolase [Sparassis crispa]
MVIFQRKLIYMGYIPPGARSEQLRDVRVPKAIHCEEIQIPSEKRVMLAGIVVRPASHIGDSPPDAVVLYLQGNAGNPLARMPVFERLLGVSSRLEPQPKARNIAVVAVAPRSYWKSSSRIPTERGLAKDYEHVLSYVCHRFPSSIIVLYGHSLGGAIAVCLASRLSGSEYPAVLGMILENPFSSIPGMVRALYPQRWLPYHYLTPFVLDKWNALAAMQTARDRPECLLARLSKNMLVLLSEKDEVVPTSMGADLYDASNDWSSAAGEDVSMDWGLKRQVVIQDALHENAWEERQWLREIHTYLDRLQQMELRRRVVT